MDVCPPQGLLGTSASVPRVDVGPWFVPRRRGAKTAGRGQRVEIHEGADSSGPELSTGEATASERDSPQVDQSYPQDDHVDGSPSDGSDGSQPVSERGSSGPAVSRETGTHLVDALLEESSKPAVTERPVVLPVVDAYDALFGTWQDEEKAAPRAPVSAAAEAAGPTLEPSSGRRIDGSHVSLGNQVDASYTHREPDPTGSAPASEAPASGDDLLPTNDDHTGSTPVSRGTKVRTAADFAESGSTPYDDSTPLARAAEHVVRARHGQLGLNGPVRPDKTRVMVVANQKGGVGKTTSTVNLAAALAQLGQKVLVIDLDPQGNASTALNIEHRRGVPSTYDLLVDGAKLEDVSTPCPDLPNLQVVPATIDLAGAEIELVSVVARESRLDRAIRAHPLVGSAEEVGEERLDFVFVDCPPSLGLLTLNALVAAEEMVIPIQAEYYALEGLGQLLETVEMVRAHLNQRLNVSTILMTMYDARTRLAANVASEVREHFGETVLKTMVPRSVRVSEAPSYSQTVMTYDPASPGALSYLEAAREIAIKGAPSS